MIQLHFMLFCALIDMQYSCKQFKSYRVEYDRGVGGATSIFNMQVNVKLKIYVHHWFAITDRKNIKIFITSKISFHAEAYKNYFLLYLENIL